MYKTIETKENILDNIKNANKAEGQNIMGCGECWYDPYYAIQQTFSEDALQAMSYVELVHLITLAEKIQEALY